MQSHLQGRSAYQPTVHRQGNRWIAYVGHHGGTDEVPGAPINALTGKAGVNGASIVDVTDPAHPKYLHHIPGLEGKYEDGGAQMVRVCGCGICRRAIRTRSTCCARSAVRGMRYAMSLIPANPLVCPISARAYAILIRTGGSATPALPISSPARPTGVRAA